MLEPSLDVVGLATDSERMDSDSSVTLSALLLPMIDSNVFSSSLFDGCLIISLHDRATSIKLQKLMLPEPEQTD